MVGGDQGTSILEDACAAVKALVPYLRAEVGDARTYVDDSHNPADGEWIRCHELVSSPSVLESVIRSTGQRLGTDDPVVAASLFVQNYSYRVLTQAVSCALVRGVVPDSRATSMAVTLSKGRPTAVAYTDPGALLVSGASETPSTAFRDPQAVGAFFDLVVSLGIDEHLLPLVSSTRERVRIGERLLWGNIADSMAVAFTTMEGCLGSWVRDIGEAFFTVGPPQLQGLGSFLAVEHAGRLGWYWERSSCCLYDRLPGKIRCSGFSLTPIDERHAAYRSSLENS